jgi:DNA-binding PadR family transcriptional regulator
VAPGSIYSSLKTLTKEGMVETAGTNQVGNRPERTLYKITPRGELELSELLRETLWQWRMPIDPLVAAISLMSLLKRDELIAGLEARAAIITGGIAHAEYAIAAIDDKETPAHVKEMLRLLNARVGAELGWSKAFVERLRRGEYRTQEDPPWQPQLASKTIPAKSAKKKPRRRTAPKRR